MLLILSVAYISGSTDSLPNLIELTEEDFTTVAQAAARGQRAHAPAPLQVSAPGPSSQGTS